MGMLFTSECIQPDIAKELFAPLDEITDDMRDPVTECAREVYFSYLNDESCSFKLFKYFDDLSKMGSGFTYNYCTDSEDNLTGICWMTAHMISHFELYHSCIFLDAMRRKTNVHLWPYMSIVVVNEIGEAHPVIEAIVMSEIDEAYKFLVQSALSMAPNVNSDNIRVVFGIISEFQKQSLNL